MTKPAMQSHPTREALIRAALHLFGEKGFEATSTREIAAAAGANIGSIAYHFGGKAGLHKACVAYIAETMKTAIADRVAQQAQDVSLTPAAARDRLMAAIETFVVFLTSRQEIEAVARFMLREMTQPTDAFETIYADVMGPTHRRLCRLWAIASGMDEDDPQTLLVVFALIGQAFYFRLAREVVLRRMTWNKVGPDEIRQIVAVLKENVMATLDYQINKNRNPAS